MFARRPNFGGVVWPGCCWGSRGRKFLWGRDCERSPDGAARGRRERGRGCGNRAAKPGQTEASPGGVIGGRRLGRCRSPLPGPGCLALPDTGARRPLQAQAWNVQTRAGYKAVLPLALVGHDRSHRWRVPRHPYPLADSTVRRIREYQMCTSGSTLARTELCKGASIQETCATGDPIRRRNQKSCVRHVFPANHGNHPSSVK